VFTTRIQQIFSTSGFLLHNYKEQSRCLGWPNQPAANMRSEFYYYRNTMCSFRSYLEHSFLFSFFFSMAPHFFGSWPLFSFLILYTVCRTPWAEDQPIARSLPTHRTTHTQNERTQISMCRVGFESTIPVFERAKTVPALDRAATVIG
jgi:hypothetical protein